MKDEQQVEAPNEPTITARIEQIREHVELAEMRLAHFRAKLWGDGSEGVAGMAALGKTAVMTPVQMLNDIGHRLASLCGDLATINQKFGCGPEPARLKPILGATSEHPAVFRRGRKLVAGRR